MLAQDTANQSKTSQYSSLGDLSGSSNYSSNVSDTTKTQAPSPALDTKTNNAGAASNSKNNIQITGDDAYQKKLAARLSQVLSTANNLITFHVFKFYGCEFVFDEYPWLENISNAKPSDPATMKMKIRWDDVTEMNQFGFFNWILHDRKTGSAAPANSNPAKILGSFDNNGFLNLLFSRIIKS